MATPSTRTSALYERVAALNERVERGELTADAQSRYWLETHLRDFVRAGVGLPEDDQARLRDLNARLAELQSSFGRTALAGSNAAAVLVTDEAELDGVSEATRAGARAAAEGRGLAEGWLLELDSCTPQGVLTEARDPGLRRRVHEASVGRGWSGEHDTRALRGRDRPAASGASPAAGLSAPLRVRGRRRLRARRPRRCRRCLSGWRLRRCATPRAEAGDLQELQDDPLQPWDWEFLAEKLKGRRYHFDSGLLRPYLELERVLHDGVFAAATALFGITFVERWDLAGYNDEVRTFEVFDADGTGIGLFLADYYTRAGKQGGAWMNDIVEQNSAARSVTGGGEQPQHREAAARVSRRC